MSKKGYPGLVLVPPSDRTIVRRRFVRWSLFGIAIIWGIFTFLSSLAPSSKSDCQPGHTQTSPSPGQEDCNPTALSAPPSHARLQETSSVAAPPPNQTPLEEHNLPTAPSPESTAPTSEQTTDHPVNADPPTARTTAEDHRGPVRPNGGLMANQLPNQSTRPNPVTDHNGAVQLGNGSAPTSGSHPPSNSGSSAADHKGGTHTPKEQPVPNQPAKVATSNTDHKPAGHAGNGTVPTQAHTKSVAPSSHPSSDRKEIVQPAHGAGQLQTPNQPTKSVNASTDHKQTAQPHSGSTPHQTSSQAGNPKPPSPDRKAVAQLGNGSAQAPNPTGNANSVAGQSGSGALLDQSLPSNAQQDARLAEGGDAFAQYRLGRLYAQQGGRQTPEAVKWYKKASTGLRHLAEAGNGQAMYVLGVMYAYGRGVKKDADQARHWLSQAVSHKITAARPILASLDRN